MMKKVVGLLLVFLLITPISAFAYDVNVNEVIPKVEVSEKFASLPDSNTVEGEYVCVDDTDDNLTVQLVDGQVGPLSTCSGNGGYARLDSAFGSGGAVTWEVNPRFSTVHFFTGQLIITKYVNQIPIPYDTVPISCTGAIGQACGDTEPLGLPKGAYGVSMVGEAKDLSGLFGWIVPPCSIGLSL